LSPTLEPKQSIDLEIVLSPPLKEYNVYFEEQPNSRYDSVKVDSVELLVHYLPADPSVVTRPSLAVPEAVELVTLEALGSVQTLRSPSRPYGWK
jgi:hypothetical protein